MTSCLLACCLVCGTGCGDSAASERTNSTARTGQADSATSRAALEKALGVALPETTQLIMYEHELGIDDMQRAKLRMSTPDFEKIAARLPVTPDAMSPGAGYLGSDDGGWDPNATPGMIAGQAALPGARYINIGFATLGEFVTMFVMEHGT